MLDAAIQNDLLKEVEQLPPPLQLRVVAFAHSLVQGRPRGTPGRELLRFAGIMTPEEGEEFLRLIDEDCEQIDPNEW